MERRIWKAAVDHSHTPQRLWRSVPSQCLGALSAANFKELKNQPKVRSEVMNDKGIGREEFSGVLVSCRFSFLVEGYVFFLISGISGFGQLSKNTVGNYFK